MIATFDPVAASLGGALLGLGLAVLFVVRRQPTGVSGVVTGMLGGTTSDTGWRLAFLSGLLAAGIGARLLAPESVAFDIGRSNTSLVFAGALVGLGAYLGNGCTSGHGVCGVSRLSARSAVATAIFLTVGAVTVLVLRRVGVAAP